MGKGSWRKRLVRWWRRRKGEPEESRTFYVNAVDENDEFDFASNRIATTKYTWYTFLPRGLFEQFRRAANIYFLFIAVVSLTPVSPVHPATTIIPLIFVVGMAMIKELWEDLQRGRSDYETNRRKVEVLSGSGSFEVRQWKDVRVGEIVRVRADSFFPADLVCLSTSHADGTAYVETMNLDGETNLKQRKALKETFEMDSDELARIRGTVECEAPNISIYTFAGKLVMDGAPDGNSPVFLGPNLILLRGSKLRNTEWAVGLAVYTGHETKIMMNATDPPSKRSFVELRLDYIIMFQLCVLLTFAMGSGIAFSVLMVKYTPQQWYLAPYDFYGQKGVKADQFDPSKPVAAAILQMFAALVLYGYFVPISLYVSMELVKLLQADIIRKDLHLYYEDKDIPMGVRTSNLNEELGMIKTVLSDKTGTLTRNQMEFFKCSIAGVSYGTGVTEVEKAAAERAGRPVPESDEDDEDDVYVPEKPLEKGFNMKDPRLDSMKWLEAPTAPLIRRFLEVLSVCQTVMVDMKGKDEPDPDAISYLAESPDEAAFVVAAKRLGFFFWGRKGENVVVREYGPGWSVAGDREYTLLNTLAFTSHRKRMSVVVRDPEGRLLLLCKGADSVVLERLAGTEDAQRYRKVTEEHMLAYAEAGLRTLAIAYRDVPQQQYDEWQSRWTEAKAYVTDAAVQAEKLEALAEELERDLTLVGATAIEDKLQVGVPQAIESLAAAGIKVWVLTGDKLETAINIGYACNLLRHGMRQHVVFLEDNEKAEKEAAKAGQSLDEFFAALVHKQIAGAKSQLEEERANASLPPEPHALVIDGKSLALALADDDVKAAFLAVALQCASVICCRVSPKQKAQVTEMVRVDGGQMCLGIGDGANDVGMIQKANIGVGIAGEEGQQAVMASDFSIGQFRFLERLLLVHGGWCYKRMAFLIRYFFFKCFALGVSQLYFNAMAMFSGTTIYYEWYLSTFQVLFTSAPVIAIAVTDQDVKAVYRLRYPGLYLQGQQNRFFSIHRIAIWMLYGIYQATALYWTVMPPWYNNAVVPQGLTWDVVTIGTMLFTTLVLSVNLEALIAVQYLTVVQHCVIWGSIVLWVGFIWLTNFLPIAWTGPVVRGAGMLFAVPGFYLQVLLSVSAALLPSIALKSLLRHLRPMDYQIVQEIAAKERKRRTFRRLTMVGSRQPLTMSPVGNGIAGSSNSSSTSSLAAPTGPVPVAI